MSDPETLQLGTVLNGKYRLVRLLGKGGVGEVFEAEHLRLQTNVAVKVLLPSAFGDRDTVARFEREARALGRVASHHVVRVLDVDTTPEGMPFVVMELLRGKDLKTLIKEVTLLPPLRAAKIVREACLGVLAAHDVGIIHRDLKPGNLFLADGPEGQVVKVVDFGVSKILDDDHEQTAASVSVGTPAYMSPEQLLTPRQIDGRADIWSLGAILYRMVSGHLPYDGKGAAAITLQIVTIDPTPLVSIAPETPPGLVAIVDRALCRELDDRFPNVATMVEALDQFIAEESPAVSARPSSRGGVSMPSMRGPSSGPASHPSMRGLQLLAGPPSQAMIANRDRTLRSGEVPEPSFEPAPAAVAAPPPAPPRSSLVGLGAIALVATVAIGGGAIWLYGRVLAKRAPAVTTALTPTPPVTSAATPTPSIEAPVAAATPNGPTIAPADSKCPAGMAFIPGGNFFMGLDSAIATPSEKPLHRVTLDAFCIDLTEVTVAAYHHLSDHGDVPRAPTMVQWAAVTPKDHKNYDELCSFDDRGKDDYPISCVDWPLADGYCKAAGKRLPTSAEWEYAARGPDGRIYPWGDDPPDAAHLNACGSECSDWQRDHGMPSEPLHKNDDGFPTTAPVGHFPPGASRYGVQDLLGNVMEWVEDWDGPYEAKPEVNPHGPTTGSARVLRGGAWDAGSAAEVRPSFRSKMAPTTRSHVVGFRCATPPAK